MDDPDKILVRSNGTVTYTGKDIAYQLWKLGLLARTGRLAPRLRLRDFATGDRTGPAQPVHYGERRPLSGPHDIRLLDDGSEALELRRRPRVYNVIDVRQSYPQKVVKEAVRILGHPEAADNSIHFAYEMVALTPEAVRVIEERTRHGLRPRRRGRWSKAYIEMSGRRGIGVKADEFLDILTTPRKTRSSDELATLERWPISTPGLGPSRSEPCAT